MTGLGVGPKVVDEMDCREINDLLAYWTDHSPPHIALHRVFLALGGTVGTSTSSTGGTTSTRITSPEQLAAEFGMTLGGADGNG